MAKKCPYYVTMTDKFMSGWGRAKGKTNKLVICCRTPEEARIVAENAQNRSEMKYVNIVKKLPYYDPSRYKVSTGSKRTHKRWFSRNAFR